MKKNFIQEIIINRSTKREGRFLPRPVENEELFDHLFVREKNKRYNRVSLRGQLSRQTSQNLDNHCPAAEEENKLLMQQILPEPVIFSISTAVKKNSRTSLLLNNL